MDRKINEHQNHLNEKFGEIEEISDGMRGGIGGIGQGTIARCRSLLIALISTSDNGLSEEEATIVIDQYLDLEEVLDPMAALINLIEAAKSNTNGGDEGDGASDPEVSSDNNT